MTAAATPKALKLLALIGKGISPVDSAAIAEAAEAGIRDVLPIRELSVLDCAAWYAESFERCGNWDSWVWDTVTGRNYNTRQLYFDGFVVCSRQLGRQNARIVKLALHNGRAVLLWEERQPLQVVRDVVVHNDQDWVTGWTLQVAGIGETSS